MKYINIQKQQHVDTDTAISDHWRLTTFLNTDSKNALIQPGHFSCMEPEFLGFGKCFNCPWRWQCLGSRWIFDHFPSMSDQLWWKPLRRCRIALKCRAKGFSTTAVWRHTWQKGVASAELLLFEWSGARRFAFSWGEIKVNILPNPNFAGPFVGFYVFKNWGR
jgi:hypothetical protein